MSTTTKKSQFLAVNLANLNKTEKQKQEEAIVNFLEKARIDADGQIAAYDLEIRRKELDLKRAAIAVNQAEKALEEARFYLPNDNTYESYVNNYNSKSQQLATAKTRLDAVKAEMADLSESKQMHADRLQDLA